MNDEKVLFDLSPEEFFYTLEQTLKRFRSDVAKERSDLFYLLVGLHHLREWIAPGYDWKKPPTQACEHFHHDVYALSEWKILNDLCNRTKHLSIRKVYLNESVGYGLPMSQWPRFSDVVQFSKGPPSGFYVDGRDIGDIFDVVINFYRDHWFLRTELPPSQ